MVHQMLFHCEGYQSAARKQQAEFLELRYEFNISLGKSGWHNRHQARRLSFEIFLYVLLLQQNRASSKSVKLKEGQVQTRGNGMLRK